jgi:hypothetical protein
MSQSAKSRNERKSPVTKNHLVLRAAIVKLEVNGRLALNDSMASRTKNRVCGSLF